MSRRLRKAGLAAALSASLAVPAAGVGLGPLTKDGIIDGPRQAFYLTLYNPYDSATEFVAYPIAADDEAVQARVAVMPAEARMASRESRQLLVIADHLTVGERYTFRVCAQRKTPPQGLALNARVCSKLTARRVA